ncbi:MAG: hypothetical protein HOO06_00915 [Bdellovibrionaceae bacterium]|nr:hypothetical protein [Pseudobdellovibrionaceae bacterium]
MDQAETQNLGWKVGDSADYSINMGFIKGTMKSFVREETSEGYWVEQNVDLMIQKSKVEILFDKATGQVLQFLVNGQKQEMPNPEDQEIVDMQEANITVPAGTFDCIYVKILNKKDNSESEAWINPNEIPISGLLKQLSNSQFGKVTVELKSFQKN